MTEQEALAVCFANLKGSKVKDLVGTARALAYLKSLYGNNVRVAQKVGVSKEIVRQFLTLLRFTESIQRLFVANELGLDQGDSLWQLKRHRPEALSEAAEIARTLTADDTRHLVDYLLKNPDVSVTEARDAVLESKTVVEREFHVVAPLSEGEYASLLLQARQRGVDPTDLVSEIVKGWLHSQGES